MSGHSFSYSRQRGQCKCRWCGMGARSIGDCAPEDVKAAVAKFAREHGVRWKSALRKLWESGTEDELLRIARNVIGPRNLDRIIPVMLKRFAS